VAEQPLNDDEELVWRSLMRLVFTLRPMLDEDLQRSCGLTSTEYSVLMHLSEAPDRQLRMSDLAERTNLSPSRISNSSNADPVPMTAAAPSPPSPASDFPPFAEHGPTIFVASENARLTI
jgi:hypothetical protein